MGINIGLGILEKAVEKKAYVAPQIGVPIFKSSKIKDVVDIDPQKKLESFKDRSNNVLQSEHCGMPDYMARIPENSHNDKKIKLLKQMFEDSKFFSRVSTCEMMYGKNFAFAEMMSQLSKKASKLILNGKSFEDVLNQIAKGYSKETTINSNLPNRIDKSGIYRGDATSSSQATTKSNPTTPAEVNPNLPTIVGKDIPLGTVQTAQQNPGITLRLATANSREDFVPICGEIKASKPINIEKIKQQIMNVYDKEIDFTKFDYTNSKSHIENLTKLSSVPFNSFSRVIDNGYFYSEDGLLAIEIASKYFKLQPEQRGFVSPLCLVLAEFTPREIIVLEKRGLLNAKTNILQERLKTITKMSDKEYEAFVIKTQNSIKSTGKSYEDLKQELFSLIKQTVSNNTYYLELAERFLGAEESVVAQIEMLKFIENTPLKLDKHDLLTFLSKININNSNNVKNVLDILLTKPNLKSHQLNSIISLTNNYTEKILIELLAITDLPVNKIIEICGHNNDFVNGKLSKEIIIEKINNDPYIKTIRAIEDTTVELRPSNTNITTLDPTNIEASSLALVHMTKYEPESGMILSTRDKLGGSRNSVHFTLNHAVTAHRSGDWDGSAIAIIMPYSSTVKTNSPGKFIEGMPNDLYTNGSVKIPKGSVIVKQNKSLQEGIVKIVEHPTIKGVKLIETSMLPHELVPTILNKMGYASIQGDAPLGLFNYGAKNGNSVDDVMQNFEAWNDFCKTQGLKPARHTGTPGALAEALIEDVGKLNANESWVVESRREKTNYKQSILNDIEVLKKWQTKGYFVSYDLDAFAKIIEESATPRQALMRMQKELNIHPTINYKTFNECSLDHSLNIYEEWLIAVEDLTALRKYVIDYELH